jgi:hypothetical protein
VNAPQPALTADFTVAQRELMPQGLEREREVTKKVLSAVPDSNRDFRLDPKSRTAWELAWHLASSEMQMLDEIADHRFDMAPRFKQESRDIADNHSVQHSRETRHLPAAHGLNGSSDLRRQSRRPGTAKVPQSGRFETALARRPFS